MTETQNWLEENFPLTIRKKITSLNIGNKKLENSLKLEGFINLKELNCWGNKITHLEVINCPHLEEIDCENNKLVDLNIKDCPQLKKLYAYSNLLTNLDLSRNSKMEELNIDNNNFPPQDLSFLSHLNNLKKLWLGNNVEGIIKQGVYNRFTGSLKFLKGMDKLELCDISNTDLDSGLEYLPKKLNDFRCSTSYFPNAKVKVFTKLIENEKGSNFSQKLQSYRHKKLKWKSTLNNKNALYNSILVYRNKNT